MIDDLPPGPMTHPAPDIYPRGMLLYSVAGELPRDNKSPNAFLDRSRWPKSLQENILQHGQLTRHSALDELLQGGCEMWRKLLR
jgi:hypothetical protein